MSLLPYASLCGTDQFARFKCWCSLTGAPFGPLRFHKSKDLAAHEVLQELIDVGYRNAHRLGIGFDHVRVASHKLWKCDIFVFETNVRNWYPRDHERAEAATRAAMHEIALAAGIEIVCLDAQFFSDLTIAFAVRVPRGADELKRLKSLAAEWTAVRRLAA